MTGYYWRSEGFDTEVNNLSQVQCCVIQDRNISNWSFILSRFSRYVVQQVLKIRELQLLQADQEPRVPLISDWDNKAGYSNFRVTGNYMPQQPVENEHILRGDQQIFLADQFYNGVLNWDVPTGDWKIIRLGYTITGKTNEPSTVEGRGFESYKLSAESTEAFFRGYPERILNESKGLIGEALYAMLIDSWETGNQNWTRDFPLEFEARRGYSITPWLLVLTGQIVESVEASDRFLWDFRRTIGDLIAENYYGKMRQLSSQYGVLLQAEAAHAGLQFMTDGINYHSRVDIPMNEFWIDSEKIGYNIRPGFSDAPSAAHLYDKNIVACESFTCGEGNWRLSPYWLKPAADKVFTMGVNRITFDTYTHQPDERNPGWNLAPWGVVHNRKLTWWEKQQPWIDYLTRCQYMLQMGNHVADFLVFAGEGVPSLLPVQFGENNGLIPPGFAFDGCNTETLLHRIKVRDGKLILPHGAAYRAIIFPDNHKMTPELVAKIAKLVKDGAIVFGEKPMASPSLQNHPYCDHTVKKFADLAWGDQKSETHRIHEYGKGMTIQGMRMNEITDFLSLQPDFEYTVVAGVADLEFIHKLNDSTHIYFISNQQENEADVICTFRIGNKRPEIWYPDMGVIEKNRPFSIVENRIYMPLHFDPYGSVFVVFREELNVDEALSAVNQSQLFMPVVKALDTIVLTGPWQVKFRDYRMATHEAITFEELVSWTKSKDNSIRYYSGTAEYSKSLLIPEDFSAHQVSIVLDLGQVREIAEVYVNGVSAGILWKPPYKADISHLLYSGENKLEVHVVNTWTNRLIGDLFLPAEERQTWINYCLPLHTSSALMESGLIGPVKLILFKDIKNDL